MGIDNTLVSQIPALEIYLNSLGYESPDCSKEFFKIIQMKPELAKKDITNLEKYLEPLIVKNVKEKKSFHSDLRNFVEKKHTTLQEVDSRKKLYHSAASSLLKRRETAEKKIKKLQEDQDPEVQKSKQLITEKKCAALKKQYDKCKKELSYLFRDLKNAEIAALLKSLPQQAVSGDWEYRKCQLEAAQEAIKTLVMRAVKKENYKDIMDYLMQLFQIIKKMNDFLDENSKSQMEKMTEIEKWKREIDACDKKQKENKTRFQKEINELLEKEQSQHHRGNDFGTCHRSVQTQVYGRELQDMGLLSKELNKLNEKEKQMIYDYIRENARQFKERFSRNIRSNVRHQINIPETCKKACETNGIPFRLVYQNPAKERTKMVIFLDVSGSCKEVSELMLVFMYFMQDLFPGGCKLYAFVNSLYDISGFMDAGDCSEAAKNILAAIPRSGAYSDYNRPFKDFYENYYNEITSDTITFFIGDARNNKNPSGEEYVKAIARKSKKSYWMNPDVLNKWGQGDSIIWTYAPYMTHLGKVSTPIELIHFLTEVK